MSDDRYRLRRRELERELAREPPTGREAQAEHRKCVAWARRDLGVLLACSTAARRLAVREAAAGDRLAGEGLAAAGEVAQALIDEIQIIEMTERRAVAPVTPDNPGPLEAVRRNLAEARARGVSFSAAWPAAIAPLPLGHKNFWRVALESTRRVWEHAYVGEPDDTARVIAEMHEPGGDWSERPNTRVAA